jgi:hypothetical protein
MTHQYPKFHLNIEFIAHVVKVQQGADIGREGKILADTLW